MSATLTVSICNNYGELARLSEKANEFLTAAAVPETAGYAANLAIEEMVTNIIKYGYDDQAVHTIHVRLACEGGVLHVGIEDDGRAFNPLHAPAPDTTKPLGDRTIGGLGIFLVRQLAQSMDYRREHGLNRLDIRILTAVHG